MKKFTRNLLFFLAIAIIALSYGCQPATDMNAADPAVAKMSTDKMITKMKKELNGFSDKISNLEKMIRDKNLSSKADMAKKMEIEEQLMELRKGAWNARNTVVAGDIQEGKMMLKTLNSQLEALKMVAKNSF